MSGALRIFRYNWTTYAATWAGAVLICVFAPRLAWMGFFAVGWSLASLLVSAYVYDVSPLQRGAWLRSLLPTRVEAWSAIDTGLDAEVALDALPGTCLGRLDIYDGELVHAPSVRRARAFTPRAHAAIACKATALPLADESCDAIALVFAAHEVRDVAARDQMFAELHRALRPGGRVLLVEHVRDLANFAAFGPGFVHFQSRATWLDVARRAAFTVAVERRVTPWVMALALERA